ncbi:hypothetical protein BASA50_005247 [Batrachochytrium salamandrivorans]|uniref:Inositol polyphosphate-related phosphatase domain-containing protein n=1 Tax=Batrachochytrium salamandrivorans TaxID=1357716 RepID=A0ABQ8FFZ9_9FUNG|nr:hypothetical protein BASA50_005247 [Batrachochytrium salamandrivorans]KAH6600168.1 hypothetical protein BASA61_002349 [Batrachochytrium salamandrivorans]KAH9272070.1 hypothetical protein BASA83_005658 [Batrachochytrium salamandrivorans]
MRCGSFQETPRWKLILGRISQRLGCPGTVKNTSPSRTRISTTLSGLGESVSRSIMEIKRRIVQGVRNRTRSQVDMKGRTNYEDLLGVFILTWNMHGHLPMNDLSLLFGNSVHATPPVLLRPTTTGGRDKYDQCHLIAVATQECQQGVDAAHKKTWEKMVLEFLQRDYQLVCTDSIGGIHLAVYVKCNVAQLVTSFASSRISTGIGNVWGNKGSVAISICFDDTSVLFVNSHFAAHQDRVAARNRDYERSNNEMVLSQLQKGDNKYPKLTDRFDHVFWAGDLNYRINGTRTLVDKLISDNQLDVLLNNDQLSIEMQKGRAFHGFCESVIRFIPTYKFDVGISASSPASYGGTASDSLWSSAQRRLSSDDPSIPKLDMNPYKYDSSRKARIPSWTDRILYKSNLKTSHGMQTNRSQSSIASSWSSNSTQRNELPINCVAYGSRMEMKSSDHKPVYGIFTINHVVKHVEVSGIYHEAELPALPSVASSGVQRDDLPPLPTDKSEKPPDMCSVQ